MNEVAKEANISEQNRERKYTIVITIISSWKILTFKHFISSNNFSFDSLSSWASVLSWLKTLIASSSIAGLSVLTGLPGSKTALKSQNLQRTIAMKLHPFIIWRSKTQYKTLRRCLVMVHMYTYLSCLGVSEYCNYNH